MVDTAGFSHLNIFAVPLSMIRCKCGGMVVDDSDRFEKAFSCAKCGCIFSESMKYWDKHFEIVQESGDKTIMDQGTTKEIATPAGEPGCQRSDKTPLAEEIKRSSPDPLTKPRKRGRPRKQQQDQGAGRDTVNPSEERTEGAGRSLNLTEHGKEASYALTPPAPDPHQSEHHNTPRPDRSPNDPGKSKGNRRRDMPLPMGGDGAECPEATTRDLMIGPEDSGPGEASALPPSPTIPPGIYQHSHKGPWWVTYNRDGQRYRQSTGTRDLAQATAFLEAIKQSIEKAKIAKLKARAIGALSATKKEKTMAKDKKCSIEGCKSPKWKERMCYRHFQEAHKDEGKPAEKEKEQPLTPAPVQTLNMPDLEKAMIAIDDMRETYSIPLDVPERALIFRVIYGAMQRAQA